MTIRGACCGLVLMVAGAVRAQELPAELSPVIVIGTAQPRSEFEMPASAARVDANALHDGRAQISLAESLARVPGLTVRERNNYAQDLQIQSRGFGARSSFGVRGVQLRIDGIPVSAPDGQGQSSSFLISSLDRVEVLRGPLAYLYGNSAGGVVAAWSVPVPAATELRAQLGADGAGTWRMGGVAADSFLDGRLGYRTELARFRGNGERPHSAAERTQFAGQLDTGFGGDRQLQLRVSSLMQPEAQDPLGLTRAQFDADPQQTDASAITFDTRKRVEDRTVGLRYTQPLGAGQRLELTGYGARRGVVQFQAIPKSAQQAPTSAGGVIDFDRDSVGAEGRYVLSLADWTLSLGLQAQALDEDRRGYENYVGDRLGVRGALRRDETNRVKVFDQVLLAEWQMTPDWLLLGALRHSALRFASDDHYVTDGNPDDSGRRGYDATIPALALQYRLSDDDRLYASWGDGFETPTINELSYRPDGSSGLNLDLDAARSRSAEAGWKRRLGSSGLFTLAAYETRTRDEIVPALNSGGRTSFQNARGGTRRRGVEAAADWRFAQDFSATLAAEYLDARFRDGFSYSSRGSIVTVAADNRLPGVARSNAFAELGWRRGRSGWSAFVEGRWSYDVPVDDVNSDAAGRYGVLGARVIYARSAGWGEYRTFLRGDNLLDRDYAGSVIVNEANGRFFEPGAGRSLFAGIELTFR
ncbi:TonB-dependent receptor [Fontimonas sp. SYSU GA230001]|uniref:TonB-dependent receptor family protein n=1 Tax=Fontimonas sp. SYSU GA230001 TaxID=3142450 RepID=UPI0032B35C48